MRVTQKAFKMEIILKNFGDFGLFRDFFKLDIILLSYYVQMNQMKEKAGN